MSDPGRGGRGKQAPYRSTHYRIPEPIKPMVEKLAATYRLLVLSEFDHQGKGLLNRVDDAIAVSFYPSNEHDTISNGNAKPGTTNIKSNEQDELDQLIATHGVITQSLIADIQKLESDRLVLQVERDCLDQELNQLHARNGDLNLELDHCREKLEAQPTRTTVHPAAIALLQNAVTPKSKGGSYAANNATGLKKLVEQAIALLELPS